MSTAISHLPAERRSRAFLRLLVGMCRRYPDLRTWLVEDFGRHEATRTRFAALVEHGELRGDERADGFAELAGETSAWATEKRQLQARQPALPARLFGGFTWDEMESLVRQYEARTLPLDVFLLARDWKKAGDFASANPTLLRAVAHLLDTAIRSGDKRGLVQLGSAIELLAEFDPRRLRTAFGYADWWKLHALIYMLHHPCDAYRTRDVRAHLAALGLSISSLDFRRFCKRHGIRRDERAGRPKRYASTTRCTDGSRVERCAAT